MPHLQGLLSSSPSSGDPPFSEIERREILNIDLARTATLASLRAGTQQGPFFLGYAPLAAAAAYFKRCDPSYPMAAHPSHSDGPRSLHSIWLYGDPVHHHERISNLIRDQWDHSLLTRLDDPEEEMGRLNVWRAMTAVIATSLSRDIPYHGRLEGNFSHRRFTTGQVVKQPDWTWHRS